jgi:hypothetical protein
MILRQGRVRGEERQGKEEQRRGKEREGGYHAEALSKLVDLSSSGRQESVHLEIKKSEGGRRG